MRVFELSDIHWPLAGFCLVGAILAVAWNAPVARHLVAIAAFAWWISSGIGLQQVQGVNPTYTVIVGASLLLGIGLALASRGPESLTKFGLTLSTYASFAFSIALALVVSGLFGAGARNAPAWFTDCSIAGLVLAFLAAAISRRAGPAFAGLAIGLALAIYTGWLRPLELPQPWSNYGLLLVAMLCLIISGMLDEVRARVVAGWLGLALMIAAITWAVRASLLQRAFFLAVAGSVAVMLAITLGRLLGRERAS
jgi:hypothetical protein